MEMTSETKAAPSGVSVGRVGGTPPRASELDRLDAFIGRWMTEGEIVGGAADESTRIVASDVYQWLPGRHFVMHPAYGRIGTAGVGGLEVIGYDAGTGQFVT
jgi:hypothetical protein